MAPKKYDIKLFVMTLIMCSGAVLLYIFYLQKQKSNVCIATFEQSNLKTRIQPDYKLIPAPGNHDVTAQIPILMYHMVNTDEHKNNVILSDMTTPVSIFEEQLKLLKSLGYRTITLDDAIKRLSETVKPQDKTIILTFDDGYSDFYQTVYPLIKKYNMKAVVFIPVNFVNHPNYLTWKQIEKMSKSDSIIFESHSLHHYPIVCLHPVEAFLETYLSKILLQLHVKNQVNWFSYPYGLFDKQSIGAVKMAGYVGAVTTIGGSQQYDTKIYTLTRDQGKMDTVSDMLTILNSDE